MPTIITWSSGFRGPSTRSERLVEFVLRSLITAVAVWVAAALVGGISLEGWGTTLLVALILGLLNASLKPLLLIGALPLVVITLGVGLVLINALLLGLTAWIAGLFDLAFEVDGFWAAFWGAVIISITSFVLNQLVKPRKLARNFG